jgi:hypothetical protein
VNNCKFIPWNNAKHFLKKYAINAVANNNLSFTTVIIPRQLPDHCALITNNDLDFKVISPDERLKIMIMNLSPFIFSIYKNESINAWKRHKQLQIQKRAWIANHSNTITIVKYNNWCYARQSAKTIHVGTSWPEIARYAGLILQVVVVVPVALTTCTLNVYAIIRAIFKKTHKEQAHYDITAHAA